MIRRRVQATSIDCDLRIAPAYTYAGVQFRILWRRSRWRSKRGEGRARRLVHNSIGPPFEIAAAAGSTTRHSSIPATTASGLMRGILGGGGIVFEDTRALDVDGRSGVVRTDRGTIKAAVIVIASHVPFVDTGLLARLTASRSYTVSFQSQSEPPTGMYISVDEADSIENAPPQATAISSSAVRLTPWVKTRIRSGDTTPWSRGQWSAAAPGLDYRWSAQDYRSVDGLPFVGPLGSSGRVFMATGFAKWGMAIGTIAGSDHGRSGHGPGESVGHVFRFEKGCPQTGAPDLVKANAARRQEPGHRATASHRSSRCGRFGPGAGDVVSSGGRRQR